MPRFFIFFFNFFFKDSRLSIVEKRNMPTSVLIYEVQRHGSYSMSHTIELSWFFFLLSRKKNQDIWQHGISNMEYVIVQYRQQCALVKNFICRINYVTPKKRYWIQRGHLKIKKNSYFERNTGNLYVVSICWNEIWKCFKMMMPDWSSSMSVHHAEL